jgi:hypothetical protein
MVASPAGYVPPATAVNGFALTGAPSCVDIAFLAVGKKTAAHFEKEAGPKFQALKLCVATYFSRHGRVRQVVFLVVWHNGRYSVYTSVPLVSGQRPAPVKGARHIEVMAYRVYGGNKVRYTRKAYVGLRIKVDDRLVKLPVARALGIRMP